MNAARTRIGRVKMKDGGADVRVLRREQDANIVVSHMREWLAGCLTDERAPDAYAAVAFWFNPDDPGRPTHLTGWVTQMDGLPPPALVRAAGAHLVADQAAEMGRERALSALGYSTKSWTPDDGSDPAA